jgi:hypothetical protein
VDTWVLTYTVQNATGWWRSGDTYSTGPETWTYSNDKQYGFALASSTHGSYEFTRQGGGWNETRDQTAQVSDTNINFPQSSGIYFHFQIGGLTEAQPYLLGGIIFILVAAFLMVLRRKSSRVTPAQAVQVAAPGQTSNIAKGITGSEVEEKEVYSFGPMGVMIFFSRPSTFAWRRTNMTKITLTDRRIYGSTPLFKRSVQFQVPYDSILAMEQTSFGLSKGFWIQYRDQDKIKEVSILGGLIFSPNISKAYDLLQTARASIRSSAPAATQTGTKFCLNCGQKISANSKFCSSCGATQQ